MRASRDLIKQYNLRARHFADNTPVDVSTLFPIAPARIWFLGGTLATAQMSALFQGLSTQVTNGSLPTRFMQIALRSNQSRNIGRSPALPVVVKKRWSLGCNMAILQGLPKYRPVSQTALGHWRNVAKGGLNNARGG